MADSGATDEHAPDRLSSAQALRCSEAAEEPSISVLSKPHRSAAPRPRGPRIPARPGIVAAACAIALVALAASEVLAAGPRLLSAGQSGSQLTARWSLPPAHTSDLIEVNRQPTVGRDGSFRGPFVFTDALRPRQQSWRSGVRFASGTYFVHVSACERTDPACAGRDRWSNVRRVVLRTRDYYFGRSRQGQPVRFSVAPSGRKVEGLQLSYRGSCQAGSFSGRVRFLRPIRVGRDDRFSNFGRFNSGIHAGSVSVRGRLLGYGESVGRLRARLSRSPAGRCDSGSVRWEAVTRTF